MSQCKAVRIIEGLLLLQYKQYTYEQFLKALKRRLMIFTGQTEVMFFSEIQVAEAVIELGILGKHKK